MTENGCVQIYEKYYNVIFVTGGVAEKSGKLAIGDELLSINGESVLTKPLSDAIKLLQNSGQRVQLQLCRKVTGNFWFLLHQKCKNLNMFLYICNISNI